MSMHLHVHSCTLQGISKQGLEACLLWTHLPIHVLIQMKLVIYSIVLNLIFM